MKKIILFGLAFLFIIQIASASSYVFKQNQEIDLKIACVDEVEQPCNETIDCNITILYPNSTALVDNQVMDYGAVYYNYTIPSTETSVLGEYSANIFCLGTGNGYSTFSFDINPIGKKPSGTVGGLAIAVVIAMIAAAGLCFFLGHMFKSEDQRWYNFILRAVFYMFSIGFIMLAIGSLNQLATESDVGGTSEISNIITGGVVLIARMQYFFFILIFIFFLVWFVEWVLLRRRKKDEEEGRFDR